MSFKQPCKSCKLTTDCRQVPAFTSLSISICKSLAHPPWRETRAGLGKLFSDERIWGAGAEGFTRIIAEPRRRFLLRTDVADQLQIDMFRGDNHPGQLSRFAGRETLRSVTLKNGENALIRAYRHGGVFRWITGKKFFSWPPRPFRELAITEELRRRGVPTVEVYGAGRGGYYRAFLPRLAHHPRVEGLL
jgi:hypothetical protein